MKPEIDHVFERCGGRQKLRQSLGLSKQTLSDWKRAGYVPAKHAVAVEALSGISRQELCPAFDWGQNQPQRKRRATDKTEA